MAALYSHNLISAHVSEETGPLSGYFDFPFDYVIVRDINAQCTIGGVANESGIGVNVGGFWLFEETLTYDYGVVISTVPTNLRWRGRQVFGGEAEWVVSATGPGTWDVLVSGYVLSP